MGAILERWKGLSGYSRRDSMAAYLAIARQWSGFGCTLYEVDFYIVSVFAELAVLARCSRVELEVSEGSTACFSDICLPPPPPPSSSSSASPELDRKFFPEAVVGCCCYICVSVPARRGRGPGVLPLRPDLLLRGVGQQHLQDNSRRSRPAIRNHQGTVAPEPSRLGEGVGEECRK